MEQNPTVAGPHQQLVPPPRLAATHAAWQGSSVTMAPLSPRSRRRTERGELGHG